MPITNDDLGSIRSSGITNDDLGATGYKTEPTDTTSAKTTQVQIPSFRDNLTKLGVPTEETEAMKRQASFTGLLSIGTTLAKAAVKPYSKENARAIQDYYEKQHMKMSENIQNNPDQALGLLAANFVGAAAPTALVPGGLALKAASTVGKLIPATGLVGRIGGAVAGGAVEGAGYGAMMTQVGQGEDVLNTSGAKTGAMLGGLLGPAQQAVGAYTKGASNYEDALQSVNKAGEWKGPLFNRDVLGGWRQKAGNKILDQLPLGTGGAREAQVENLKPFLQDWITNMTNLKSPQQIMHAINKSKIDIEDIENQGWSNFSVVMGNVKIPTTNTQTAAKALQDASISKKFQSVVDPLSVTKTLNISELQSLKSRAWKFKEQITKTANPDTDAADAAWDLYRAIDTDIRNAASATKEGLEAFESANLITTAKHEIFNPKTQGELVKALKDKDGMEQGLRNFVNWITKPSDSKTSITERGMQQTMGLLGKDVNDKLASMGFQKVLDDSITVGTNRVDVTKFLTGIKEIQSNAATNLLYQPHLDALEGLTKYVMNPQVISQSQRSNTALGAVGTAVGASIAAGQSSLAVGIVASVPALSYISAHSPVKNALITLNKTANNPKMSQYLIDIVNKQMIKAGIVLKNSTDESGQNITELDLSVPQKK